MCKIDDREFMNPHNKYRMKLMQHNWESGTKKVMMDALVHCGYGGAVTNPAWNHSEKSEEKLMSLRQKNFF